MTNWNAHWMWLTFVPSLPRFIIYVLSVVDLRCISYHLSLRPVRLRTIGVRGGKTGSRRWGKEIIPLLEHEGYVREY